MEKGLSKIRPKATSETQPAGAGKTQFGGLLMHFGRNLLIDKYSIFVERTTEAGKSAITTYLYSKDCRFSLPGKQERCAGESPSSSTSPLLAPMSSHGAASTPTVSKNGDSRLFYFVVLNKNALRATLAKGGLPAACLFTVQTLLHTDAEVLTRSQQNYRSHVDSSRPHTCMDQGRDTDNSIPHASMDCGSEGHATSMPVVAQSQPEFPLQVVLDFPAASLHWYSYIHSGCLYSLAVPTTSSSSSGAKCLPSLESLRSEPYVVVEEGVEIQLLDAIQCSSCCTPVEDVSELVSKLYLPRFTTTSGIPMETK